MEDIAGSSAEFGAPGIGEHEGEAEAISDQHTDQHRLNTRQQRQQPERQRQSGYRHPIFAAISWRVRERASNNALGAPRRMRTSTLRNDTFWIHPRSD